MILIQGPYFEELEPRATYTVQGEQIDERQVLTVRRWVSALWMLNMLHLFLQFFHPPCLPPQDLAHIYSTMLNKGRKSPTRGMFIQEQLLEKVNLELDLWGNGGHGWSPRVVKGKGAGKRAFPVKCTKLWAYNIFQEPGNMQREINIVIEHLPHLWTSKMLREHFYFFLLTQEALEMCTISLDYQPQWVGSSTCTSHDFLRV